MTKAELKQKVDYYYRKYNEYKNELDRMNRVFEIDKMDKPMKQYSLAETQQLLELNKKAFDWAIANENADLTIYDYNKQALEADKINLAK